MRIPVIGLIVSLLFIMSCKKDEERDDDEIPYVPVSFTIYPNNTIDYIEINGFRYYDSQGFKGIVVYRLNKDEFRVYDRACPYDFRKDCAQIEVEASFSTAIDSCCMSRYFLMDGMPFEGPASKPLLQYQATYNGNALHIYN